MRTFTILFTCIGAALCFVHFIGHDYEPIYLLFYALSVPAWFAPAFGDITRVNIALVYLLTIASWAIIGYVIDFFIARGRRRTTY
jgi:hypothetical protein